MRDDVIWRYQVVPEETSHPNIGKYHTYGIQIIPPESIHDISTDKTIVERMANLFTEHQLSPIHFRDAVEDMLP